MCGDDAAPSLSSFHLLSRRHAVTYQLSPSSDAQVFAFSIIEIERATLLATRHSFPMSIIIRGALDWRCETRPPPLSRPVPKPVLGSPLSTPTPSWRPPSPPPPPRQLSPLRAARGARPPARPSVVRSFFFRSSPSSSSRLFYGKEGGSERMDGRYEAAMRASERALLPIGLVATAAVVATACATRCGQCAPIFGFLVQTCCLAFPSSVHSRLTRVKNKALHVLLFFPSDPFFRRFSNRSQWVLSPCGLQEVDFAPWNRSLLWSLKCRHGACVFVHRVPCNGRGRARLRRERTEAPARRGARRAERRSPPSGQPRGLRRLRFSELFTSFFRAVAASGGMGSRARSGGSASSCRRSGSGRNVGVIGGARNVNNVQKTATQTRRKRSAFLRQ